VRDSEKEVNPMRLDTINIVLIVTAIVLGVLYFSLRNARRQKERKTGRKSG